MNDDEELRWVRRREGTHRSESRATRGYERDLLRDDDTRNLLGPTESRPADIDEIVRSRRPVAPARPSPGQESGYQVGDAKGRAAFWRPRFDHRLPHDRPRRLLARSATLAGAQGAEICKSGCMLLLPQTGTNSRRVAPSSVGFEWWYLQLVGRDFAGTIVAHTTPMLGGPSCEPYLSVYFVYGNLTIDTKVPLAVATFRLSPTSIELGVAGEAFAIEGEAVACGLGLRLDDSRVLQRVNGDWTYWEVPVADGIWTGSLRLGSVRLESEARAYQDHNWGQGHLAEYYSKWDWHSVSSPSGSNVGVDALGVMKDQRFRFASSDAHQSLTSDVVKYRNYSNEGVRAYYERSLVRGRMRQPYGFRERLEFMEGRAVTRLGALRDE